MLPFFYSILNSQLALRCNHLPKVRNSVSGYAQRQVEEGNLEGPSLNLTEKSLLKTLLRSSPLLNIGLTTYTNNLKKDAQ